MSYALTWVFQEVKWKMEIILVLKMFEYISTGRPILISPRISLIETFGHLPSVFVVQDDLSDLILELIK